MIDPPWTWILDTSVMERGRASSIRPWMRCSKPSMIPRTSHPEFRASIVAAEMTEFIPGAGPPPQRIPSFMPSSFQRRGDPGKRARRYCPHHAVLFDAFDRRLPVADSVAATAVGARGGGPSFPR
jgi:hypothetical protein